MPVVSCPLPDNTALDRVLIDNAFFADACCVPLSRSDASITDIFFAIFGHHPAWLKAFLWVRHRVGAWLGLDAASSSQIWRPTKEENYRVGQAIGAWPIYFLCESEVVAGRDNKHLDFRVSVLKHGDGQATYATVSTVCRVRNRFGRAYLRVIAPFHQWGVRRLLSRAAEAGRL